MCRPRPVRSVSNCPTCSASGEGVNPQEYTLIKLEVVQDAGTLPARLAAIQEAMSKSETVFADGVRVSATRRVFLVAATLRPETMYG